jgi:hypothetical protein
MHPAQTDGPKPAFASKSTNGAPRRTTEYDAYAKAAAERKRACRIDSTRPRCGVYRNARI